MRAVHAEQLPGRKKEKIPKKERKKPKVTGAKEQRRDISLPSSSLFSPPQEEREGEEKKKRETFTLDSSFFGANFPPPLLFSFPPSPFPSFFFSSFFFPLPLFAKLLLVGEAGGKCRS